MGKAGFPRRQLKTVLKKWLNITNKADFNADHDEPVHDQGNDLVNEVSTSEGAANTPLRRRKSETLRSQYINNKEIRICVGTWNVGGITPSDDLKIEDWVDAPEPADIYVLGKIIWLGDLNYRINLPYEKTRELISKQEWTKLAEMDQLKEELRKGHTFDGWTEGEINFAPTYKYKFNSTEYVGDDPKSGRRTPAWCDRILSFGNDIKLQRYKRSEHGLSDHRPVTAAFTAEMRGSDKESFIRISLSRM